MRVSSRSPRGPARYGRWRDGQEWRQHQEGPALILSHRIAGMLRAAWTAFAADLDADLPPRPEPEPRPPRGADSDQR